MYIINFLSQSALISIMKDKNVGYHFIQCDSLAIMFAHGHGYFMGLSGYRMQCVISEVEPQTWVSSSSQTHLFIGSRFKHGQLRDFRG